VVDEAKLSAALAEFARTLTTDSPIQRTLDDLVMRIVEILPITASGITLISAGQVPRYISASDVSPLRFERLQVQIGQGPSLMAHLSGTPVTAPDLTTDRRFTRFAPAARSVGLAAVFSFPLRHGDERLGTLDLYRDTPGTLTARDTGAAQTLADIAASYLLIARAREDVLASSEKSRHSSLHDPLTGLPNRQMLQERLEHAALRAKRSHTNSAVLFADLDRFKQVNDSHGHQVGDELLVAVAKRLSALVRPGDTLARFAGDEFVFLCEDLVSVADAEFLAQRIADAFEAPFSIVGVELTITASIGTCYSGPGEELSQQLLINADTAMYEAKRNGGARSQLFNHHQSRRMTDHLSLHKELREALTDDALDVEYQPLIRSSDGLITGVEALLRWNDPERGQVSPLAMIAVAEQSGLISEIGAWVLERSCRDRAGWIAVHPDLSLDLAINVSQRQLMSAGFVATVASVLLRTATDPSTVVLDITENALIEDRDRSAVVLAELRKLGVRLALDDFGIGYTSLSYLRRMPFDTVKLARDFVAEIGRAPGIDSILVAVADLTHAFGFTVTAKGVETQQQHQQINTMGYDSAQGFFYAHPMPAVALRSYLDTVPVATLHRNGSSSRRDVPVHKPVQVSVVIPAQVRATDNIPRDTTGGAA
jgi:diguanylate cyclase (GGDEF)-like protein